MPWTAEPGALLLPEGTRVLHIGPPKTGTTALQNAFHVSRAAVAAQGVHYTGQSRQPVTAVLAVSGRPSPSTEGKAPPIGKWHDLVREVRRAREPRVVISSEFFADTKPDVIRTIVTDLDPSRLHVVVTLRPLARIVTSQWQQYVQAGLRTSFDDWLRAMFLEPPGKISPSFWRRHRHDQLVDRWAAAVGASNLTVIALDERDHGMVLRVFEQLVGLADGTLAPDPDRANRSMTLPEVEVVRAFNRAYKAAGLGTPLHSSVMRFGAAMYMKAREPDPSEPRVEAPQWALDRAGEVAREMVDGIAASGVRVIGDLTALTEVPRSRLEGDRVPEVLVPPDIAATALMGVIVSSGLARRGAGSLLEDGEAPEDLRPVLPPGTPPPPIELPDLFRVSNRQMIGTLVRRARRAAVERWRGIRPKR